MRILLTGAGGQLGRAFTRAAPGTLEVVPAFHHAPSPAAADLTLPLEDLDRIAQHVARVRPRWIVHAAALTDVDQCESDPARAMRINAEATERLCQAAKAAEARFLYVSTDYVFSGQKGPYGEPDPTGPVNHYGRSKLAGEQSVRRHLADAIIARTSSVFSKGGRNFVTWVQAELGAGRRIRAAFDQRSNPTWAGDLAGQLHALIEADATGTFHTAGATAVSRAEAARAVARTLRLDAALIDPVPASSLAWRAPRPHDSSLDVRRIAKYKTPLSLEESLARFAAERGA